MRGNQDYLTVLFIMVQKHQRYNKFQASMKIKSLYLRCKASTNTAKFRFEASKQFETPIISSRQQ